MLNVRGSKFFKRYLINNMYKLFTKLKNLNYCKSKNEMIIFSYNTSKYI